MFNSWFKSKKENDPLNSSEMASESIKDHETVTLSDEQFNALKTQIREELHQQLMGELLPQIDKDGILTSIKAYVDYALANEVMNFLKNSYLPDINNWCDARYRKRLVHEKKSLSDWINDKHAVDTETKEENAE